MEYKFLRYNDIEQFFMSSNISAIRTMMENAFLICSVSDILYISEQFKKNHIKTTIASLNSNYKILTEEHNLYFPEIDRENLLDNLFDIEDQATVFWYKACNINISPRYSISLLAIKLNESSFWSEETFEEMTEYYLNFENE